MQKYFNSASVIILFVLFFLYFVSGWFISSWYNGRMFPGKNEPTKVEVGIGGGPKATVTQDKDEASEVDMLCIPLEQDPQERLQEI